MFDTAGTENLSPTAALERLLAIEVADTKPAGRPDGCLPSRATWCRAPAGGETCGSSRSLGPIRGQLGAATVVRRAVPTAGRCGRRQAHGAAEGS